MSPRRGRGRRIEAAERTAQKARLAAVSMAEKAKELLHGKEFFEVPCPAFPLAHPLWPRAWHGKHA
jgi:hypothetical protein